MNACKVMTHALIFGTIFLFTFLASFYVSSKFSKPMPVQQCLQSGWTCVQDGSGIFCVPPSGVPAQVK